MNVLLLGLLHKYNSDNVMLLFREGWSLIIDSHNDFNKNILLSWVRRLNSPKHAECIQTSKW